MDSGPAKPGHAMRSGFNTLSALIEFQEDFLTHFLRCRSIVEKV
jgi:hypothetical protein